ncbi:MAG: phosphotransferase, partial [bacterium]|nr:phosphotransferase [bacterium]
MRALHNGILRAMRYEFPSPFWMTQEAQAYSDAEPLRGDASTRRYARLANNDGATAILVQYPPRAYKDLEHDLTVNSWLIKRGVVTPEVYCCDLVNGWAVLQDFGVRDAARVLAEMNSTDRSSCALRLIQPLVRLSQLPLEPPPPGGPRLDHPRLRWELTGFELWFVGALCGGRVVSEISRWLDALVDSVAASPQRVCHRDYHLNNVFLLHNDNVGVIDAQDTLVGPDTYDVVSLLEERDMPDLLSRKARQACLEDWAQQTSADEGWFDRYCAVRLQRALKVIGTFSRLVLSGREEYRPWLVQVVQRLVTELNTCQAPDCLTSTLINWCDSGG